MSRRPPKRKIGDSAHLVETFLDMMSAERGASANTLAAYRRDLSDFSTHAGIAAASREDIRGFLAALSASGIAASTQMRKLSALRQFLRLSLRRGFPPRRSH